MRSLIKWPSAYPLMIYNAVIGPELPFSDPHTIMLGESEVLNHKIYS